MVFHALLDILIETFVGINLADKFDFSQVNSLFYLGDLGILTLYSIYLWYRADKEEKNAWLKNKNSLILKLKGDCTNYLTLAHMNLWVEQKGNAMKKSIILTLLTIITLGIFRPSAVLADSQKLLSGT